jgi:hypothetical protein
MYVSIDAYHQKHVHDIELLNPINECFGMIACVTVKQQGLIHVTTL